MPPVENEHSCEVSQRIIRTTSSTSTKRPIGMRERMSARRAGGIPGLQLEPERERALDPFARLGISHAVDRYPKQFSGGVNSFK